MRERRREVRSADAIVIGAGAAGLSAAAMLSRLGVAVTVLESADAVGASWRSRYDGLRLNSTASMSTMPGYRATRRKYGEFPTRDAWVRYLEDYTAHHGLKVSFDAEAIAVSADENGWRVQTQAGEMRARFLVIATGHDRTPDLPDWPGRDEFRGDLVHSSAYRNPTPYVGRDVLVVGPNVTGSEVACHLVRGGARRVRVSMRTPVTMSRRKFAGLSVHIPGIALNYLPLRVADFISWRTQVQMFGRLDRYGLPKAPVGVATNLAKYQQAGALDDGFIAELKAGRIEIVPAVASFDGDDVVLDDGTRIQPDAVIASTGYMRGLDGLVGHLGVLDDRGVPLVSKGRQHPTAPGLFFNGYEADLSGQLRLMRFGARSIAAEVKRQMAA
jgi:putative flavoprotein involved in K+ transport